MQKKTSRDSPRLMKVPAILEDFLFKNPDLAIIFNDMPISHKNQWIQEFRKAKTEKALNMLFSMMQKKYLETGKNIE